MRGDAVRLLTAHRSKGLEWRLVVVAHVQEEGWPDLRRRSTLLQADRIGADGLVPPTPTARRCWPRSAGCSTSPAPAPASGWSSPPSASPDDDGEQPSRFVDELAAASGPRTSGQHRRAGRAGRCPWPGSSPSCGARVADPRRPGAARGGRRPAGAAGRRAAHGGQPLVPAADPATWWGTRAAALRRRPSRAADEPVDALGERAGRRSSTARPSGSSSARPAASCRPTPVPGLRAVVHALADRVAKGELAGRRPREVLTS